ncbi:MAG: molybdopterin-dependent oxidoreductase [Granulosicoccus sp.]
MSRQQPSVCPHDCPSVCALDVEVLDDKTIGKVRGVKSHSYTEGVICAKVSRYAERIHHPERLLYPLKRVGAKGVGRAAFERIGWDEALDQIVERLKCIIEQTGSEAIWPFHYAGTMGLVQRDGLDRFRRALQTSRQHSTYCTSIADAGWLAGAGVKRGSDVRMLQHSELIVVWGGNPVSTQVNMMHHIAKARRHNKAKLVVIDPYRTITARQSDQHLMLRPGTDGALACAVMHILFAEGMADRDYLKQHTDVPDQLEAHLASRTPAWASAITGLTEEAIVRFAREYGRTKKTFLRLGYGFSRSRNGAVSMHAASCLPAITGAWTVKGGGALYGNGDIYALDRSLIHGNDIPSETRLFDQSRIGAVLCGDASDLQGGPAVEALFIQNTNPAVVAPDTRRVLRGLARGDLFTVVHEQFMTETAGYADLVLPATMFLEHDDLYTASGHTHLQVGAKVIDAPGECRSNHALLCELASRLQPVFPAFDHPAYAMCESELIEATLSASGLPNMQSIIDTGGLDCAPEFGTANFLDGFGTADKRFRFAPDWAALGPDSSGMPSLPDHWAVTDEVSAKYPLRLVAAPARQFLNTSFTETPGSRRMEKRPTVKMHPDDLVRFDLTDGALVTISNAQGEVSLWVSSFDGLQSGTIVVESVWPNADFPGGLGINTLISAEPGKPNGGAVFHDTAVRVSVAVNPD